MASGYTANDSVPGLPDGWSADSEISGTVGGPIVALDDSGETILDEAVAVSPLDNDTSAVDGALSIAIVTAPTHGQLLFGLQQL